MTISSRPVGDGGETVVGDYWSRPRDEILPSGTQWTEIAAVQRHLNARSSGYAELDWLAHSEVFAARFAKPRRALSLACGSGLIERILRARDICQVIDGIDVAEGALEEARSLAEEQGLDGLTYRRLDLDTDELPEGEYDVVYAHAALHHVFQLEHALEQVRRALRPNGLLVLYEYVGPSQMQFGRAELALADRLLSVIPERLRTNLRTRDGSFKTEAPRLSLRELQDVDPSESIRSSEIIPLVAGRFRLRHLRYIGGTLLLLVLNDIAGNFAEDDDEALRWIETLVGLDAFVVDACAVPSYHAYAVAEKADGELLAQQQEVALQQHARPLLRAGGGLAAEVPGVLP